MPILGQSALSTGGGTLTGELISSVDGSVVAANVALQNTGAAADFDTILTASNGASQQVFAIDTAGDCAVRLREPTAGFAVVAPGNQTNSPLLVTVGSGAAGIAANLALLTQPPASQDAALTLGVAYQNTVGVDVLLLVCLNCTANTSVVIQLGVGSTSTPTQQTIITGSTATGIWPIPIYLPRLYYALLSKTGTGTVAIAGQTAMPI